MRNQKSPFPVSMISLTKKIKTRDRVLLKYGGHSLFIHLRAYQLSTNGEVYLGARRPVLVESEVTLFWFAYFVSPTFFASTS